MQIHALRRYLRGGAYGILLLIVNVLIIGLTIDLFIPIFPKYSKNISVNTILSIHPGDKCSNATDVMGRPIAESITKWPTLIKGKSITQTRYDYGVSGLLYGPYQIMLFCEDGYVDIVTVEISKELSEYSIYYCDRKKCPKTYDKDQMAGLELYLR